MKIKRKKRIGLIGCGEIAHRYADAFGEQVKALQLSVVWDIDDAAKKDFADRFRVKASPTFDDFLNEPLDLICVCTPNDTRVPVVESCLLAGYDVLAEHPLATESSLADQLCLTASRLKRDLFVMRQRRFLASVQSLKAVLQRGLLGSVLKVKAHVVWNRHPEYFAARPWRRNPRNGGVVLNQASHFLDILLYLFGDVTVAKGFLGNIRHPLPVEDSVYGLFRFRTGLSAEFACTTAAPEGRNRSCLRVIGTRGEIVLTGRAWEKLESMTDTEPGSLPQQLETPLSGDHAGFLQRVAQRLSGHAVEIVDAVEGARTARLIDLIYRNFKMDTQALVPYFVPLF